MQSVQHHRMCHAYCYRLNRGWKKIRFQLVLNKTFCLTTQPSPTDNESTAKEQKFTKHCFLLPSHWFSDEKQISDDIKTEKQINISF